MDAVWRFTADAIECTGAIVIATAAFAAIALLILCHSIAYARRIFANGAIAGLDFKLAATLLKALALLEWQQIKMFAVILSLRMILKLTFAAEEQKGELWRRKKKT